jgi:hypothetical protein
MYSCIKIIQKTQDYRLSLYMNTEKNIGLQIIFIHEYTELWIIFIHEYTKIEYIHVKR